MSVADVVRLFAIPIFGLIAYRDVKFRRVPSRVWYPLVGLGIVTLAYDLYQFRDAPSNLQQTILLEVAVGIVFLSVLAGILHWLDIVDVTVARALAVIGLVYPLVPTDPLFGFDLPLLRPGHGILSFTVLSNAALAGLLYPIGYAILNGLNGRFAPVMFVGRPVDPESVADRPGRFLQTASGYTLRGPDLETIRTYLRWREVTISLITQRPEALRDPDYRADPTDRTDGERSEFTSDPEDPWGAEAFLDEGEYVEGLLAEDLRSVLDLLAEEEEVWVSANFPFAVPIFFGLLIGVTVGDLATGLLQFIG